MKNRYIIFILTLCFLSVSSCRVKEGEPGPAGASALNKEGFIKGTLRYLDYKGDSVIQAFAYEYYESLVENEYWIDSSDGTNYEIHVFRRDLNDSEKHAAFSLFGTIDNHVVQAPDYGSVDFSYVNMINGDLFAFDDISNTSSSFNELYFDNSSSTSCDISNFKLDINANTLSFDYVTTYDANDISYDDQYNNFNPATVRGSLSIRLKKRNYSTYTPPVVAKTSQE